MAKYFNPTISQDAVRIFNLKAGDNLTSDIGNLIVPVVPITRFSNILKTATATNNTAATIYTTPSDKDFYLTGVQIAVSKDATATSLGTDVTVFYNSVNTRIIKISTNQLQVQNEAVSQVFNPPLLIDKGTAIVLNNSTNVANIVSSACIYGYTVETNSSVSL